MRSKGSSMSKQQSVITSEWLTRPPMIWIENDSWNHLRCLNTYILLYVNPYHVRSCHNLIHNLWIIAYGLDGIKSADLIHWTVLDSQIVIRISFSIHILPNTNQEEENHITMDLDSQEEPVTKWSYCVFYRRQVISGQSCVDLVVLSIWRLI